MSLSLLLLILIGAPEASKAHPLDVIYFDIQKLNAESVLPVKSCFTFNKLAFEEFKKANSEFNKEQFLTTMNFELLLNQSTCTTEQRPFDSLLKNNLTEQEEKICFITHCNASEKLGDSSLTLKFNFLKKLSIDFKLIGSSRLTDQEFLFNASLQNSEIQLSAKESHFIELGIEHVGGAVQAWVDENNKFKVADGIDHVLFILVLLLMSSSFKNLFLNISSFTIGHSVALFAALTQLVSISAQITEPLIALSIALVALIGFLNFNFKKSYLMIILLGFLHGIGFSYILGELHSSNIQTLLLTIFKFNLGVEIGQIFIVLFALPFYFFCKKVKGYGLILERFIFALVFLLSSYWTAERVLTNF